MYVCMGGVAFSFGRSILVFVMLPVSLLFWMMDTHGMLLLLLLLLYVWKTYCNV